MIHHPHRRHLRIAGLAVATLAVLAAAPVSASSSAAPAAAVAASAPLVGNDQEVLGFPEYLDDFFENGTVALGTVDIWRVNAVAGMTMDIKISSPDDAAMLLLRSPSGVDLLPHEPEFEYRAVLDESGEYEIVVTNTNVAGFGGDVDYLLYGTIDHHSLYRNSTRVEFPSGATGADLEGQVFAEGFEGWVLDAAAGQVISLNSYGQLLHYAVYGPDFVYIAGGLTNEPNELVLVADGDHYVTIWQEESLDPNSYRLRLELSGSADGLIDASRLLFAPDEDTSEAGGILADGWDRWVFTGRQDLAVFIESQLDPVYWELMTIGGVVLASGNDVGDVSVAQLPADGDYYLVVNHPSAMIGWIGPADYALVVEIPGLNTGGDTPDLASAERFQMARGTHVGEIAGAVGGADADMWVMGVAGGQTVQIAQLGGAVDWQLLTSLGDTIGSGAGNGEVYIYDDGDYYLRVSATASSAEVGYVLQITIPPL